MAEQRAAESKSNRIGLLVFLFRVLLSSFLNCGFRQELGVDISEFSQSTGISIPTVNRIRVQHLSDYLPNLPTYRNRFARTHTGSSDANQHYHQEISADQYTFHLVSPYAASI